ncbi:hypothetical protein KZX47_05900 [Thermus sp. SYSU G05001]|uniref:Uncharacterized protein n=1 Tax=Thermus brevis TaxID=2862456 RepID=A0ABS7A028_9DEIN|nr:hypothetical protein [Thermus brevis]
MLYHHERWNGPGTPRASKGKKSTGGENPRPGRRVRRPYP